MTRVCSTALLLLALLPVIAFGQSQQVIHLKDGSFVKGEVVSQDSSKLLVRTEYGNLEIPKANVLRIDSIEAPKPVPPSAETQTQRESLATETENGYWGKSDWMRTAGFQAEWLPVEGEGLTGSPTLGRFAGDAALRYKKLYLRGRAGICLGARSNSELALPEAELDVGLNNKSGGLTGNIKSEIRGDYFIGLKYIEGVVGQDWASGEVGSLTDVVFGFGLEAQWHQVRRNTGFALDMDMSFGALTLAGVVVSTLSGMPPDFGQAPGEIQLQTHFGYRFADGITAKLGLGMHALCTSLPSDPTRLAAGGGFGPSLRIEGAF
ncbi:MAG: hypothetical protein NTX53_18755 [candidate division WOR-3 bacterium]|nr:hypothetical protein [candidate division WOR-3 bacterium]